jgi:hypothetical protein
LAWFGVLPREAAVVRAGVLSRAAQGGCFVVRVGLEEPARLRVARGAELVHLGRYWGALVGQGCAVVTEWLVHLDERAVGKPFDHPGFHTVFE